MEGGVWIFTWQKFLETLEGGLVMRDAGVGGKDRARTLVSALARMQSSCTNMA